MPASGVLAVIEECVARGVGFAVILSSGFGEAGEEGEREQLRMKEIAERGNLRLYGPNCPGLTNVNHRLGLTFSPSFPHDLTKGPIGLATQGGGLGRNVMQAMERGIGIGLWASTGNEVDLQVADFIYYMADAPDIKVVVRGARTRVHVAGATRPLHRSAGEKTVADLPATVRGARHHLRSERALAQPSTFNAEISA